MSSTRTMPPTRAGSARTSSGRTLPRGLGQQRRLHTPTPPCQVPMPRSGLPLEVRHKHAHLSSSYVLSVKISSAPGNTVIVVLALVGFERSFGCPVCPHPFASNLVSICKSREPFSQGGFGLCCLCRVSACSERDPIMIPMDAVYHLARQRLRTAFRKSTSPRSRSAGSNIADQSS